MSKIVIFVLSLFNTFTKFLALFTLLWYYLVSLLTRIFNLIRLLSSIVFPLFIIGIQAPNCLNLYKLSGLLLKYSMTSQCRSRNSSALIAAFSYNKMITKNLVAVITLRIVQHMIVTL